MLRLWMIVSLLILSTACSEYEVRKDYLKSRASERLQLPEDIELGRVKNRQPSPELSEAEIEAIDPDALIVPPLIVEEKPSSQSPKGAASRLSVALKRDDNGVSFLLIDADYDAVWREIRLSLLATGFTLTDMNRSDGLFYIRYKDPDDDRDEYVLQLIRAAGGSRVLVRSIEGKILATEAASRILSLLKANL